MKLSFVLVLLSFATTHASECWITANGSCPDHSGFCGGSFPCSFNDNVWRVEQNKPTIDTEAACLERAKQQYDWCGMLTSHPSQSVTASWRTGSDASTEIAAIDYTYTTASLPANLHGCYAFIPSCPNHPTECESYPCTRQRKYGSLASNHPASTCMEHAHGYLSWCGLTPQLKGDAAFDIQHWTSGVKTTASYELGNCLYTLPSCTQSWANGITFPYTWRNMWAEDPSNGNIANSEAECIQGAEAQRVGCGAASVEHFWRPTACSVQCAPYGDNNMVKVTHDTSSSHTHHLCYFADPASPSTQNCVCKCCDSAVSDCSVNSSFSL